MKGKPLGAYSILVHLLVDNEMATQYSLPI